jgi:glycerol-3-phosphate acyltransferase PlsY
VRAQPARPDGGTASGAAIETLAVIVAGYLAGSLPFGYWVVRAGRGVEIRTLGSGNVGATNLWRVFGPRLGLTVSKPRSGSSSSR